MNIIHLIARDNYKKENLINLFKIENKYFYFYDLFFEELINFFKEYFFYLSRLSEKEFGKKLDSIFDNSYNRYVKTEELAIKTIEHDIRYNPDEEEILKERKKSLEFFLKNKKKVLKIYENIKKVLLNEFKNLD